MRGLLGQPWSRLLAFCAVPAVAGAVAFSGVQTFKASGAEENRAQTLNPPPAGAKPAPATSNSPTAGATAAPPVPPPLPPPDPRIVRALDTRVCLRAGKQAV